VLPEPGGPHGVRVKTSQSEPNAGGVSRSHGGSRAAYTPYASGLLYSFVSIPIFQFILLRWYLRFVIWFLFLWRASRLNLHLLPRTPPVLAESLSWGD